MTTVFIVTRIIDPAHFDYEEALVAGNIYADLDQAYAAVREELLDVEEITADEQLDWQEGFDDMKRPMWTLSRDQVLYSICERQF